MSDAKVPAEPQDPTPPARSAGPGSASEPPPAPTEHPLLASGDLDLLTTASLLARLHDANRTVAQAVDAALPSLGAAVDALVAGWRRGGRLIMAGAGTSGRLGVVEAAECPPTFGTPPERVVAVIAGGDQAMRGPVEGAEDDDGAGKRALASLSPTPADVVVGISASGGAPFVLAALRRAAEAGATTVGLTSVPGSPLALAACIAVVAPTGSEAVAGSTRMRAGTAQKLCLNLLTTAAMVRLGHVFGNRMVDFQPSNAKLRERAVRTVRELAGVDDTRARGALVACEWQVKPAIVAAALAIDADAARTLLSSTDGDLRRAMAPDTALRHRQGSGA